MATNNDSYNTLADIARSTGFKGDKRTINAIEMLSEVSNLVKVLPAFECNSGLVHKTKMRSTLPTVGWRRLNEGTAISKSRFSWTQDATARITGMAEVDEWELELAADPAQYMQDEAEGFIQSMTNEAESAVWYASNLTDPEKIHGFTPRFNALSGDDWSSQVVNAGGAGSDNASIWFCTAGAMHAGLLFPAGSAGGLQRKNRGTQRITDASGNPFYVEAEEYIWDIGLFVSDWRDIVRICNIDVSNLGTAGAADLYTHLRTAYYRLNKVFDPSNEGGARTYGFCNRTIMEFLDAQADEKANVLLTRKEVQGEMVTAYRGIPLYLSDALLDTEAAVS